MVTIDLTGQNVLITGGTRGIGRAAALEFARAGAQTWLTYKWGSADFDELEHEFTAAGGLKPKCIQADVSVDDDSEALFTALKSEIDGIDVFISNVGFAATTPDLASYKKRSFFKTIEYSTWPLIDYTRRVGETFGRYPRYVLGISSDGPDNFYPGYDFVAASKALLECFGRYLSMHLLEEGTRVNVIRFGTVPTDSFNMIFGDDFFDYARKQEGLTDDLILDPQTCGKTVLALCSGLMSAINGQVINADYGLPLRDNTMVRYHRSRHQETDRTTETEGSDG